MDKYTSSGKEIAQSAFSRIVFVCLVILKIKERRPKKVYLYLFRIYIEWNEFTHLRW
ncbi:hypothetical protein BDV40DRAFT_182150 [Aspergillus tamarii]|uniref:Uncharacterized protein n=1 Tax=Aspergillus tamarii TaxID=41984 RepID=A0A5N6US69_ASPTM|nr:hypothetical protein BDV40DRAFT_182150 [Aspergillus tamarii]